MYGTNDLVVAAGCKAKHPNMLIYMLNSETYKHTYILTCNKALIAYVAMTAINVP